MEATNSDQSKLRRQLASLDAEQKALISRRQDVVTDIVEHQRKMAIVKAQRDALLFLETWASSEFVLQPNDCSRLHTLITDFNRPAAFNTGIPVAPGDGPPRSAETKIADPEAAQSFVVGHDWASAFGDAMKEGEVPDEWRLPYPTCAFEFRISGLTVIMVIEDCFGHNAGFIHIQTRQGVWIHMDTYRLGKEPIMEFVMGQIKAICVALDSKIATHEVVRQPSKLNEKRIKSGKPVMRDYHVVKLDRKSRPTRTETSSDTGRKVKLHFRRGHWRQYEDHKTWINWMLVGNQDLGFIDKHYKL